MLNGAHYGSSSPNLVPEMVVAADSFWRLLNGTDGRVNVTRGCRLVAVDKTAATLTAADVLCANDQAPLRVLAQVFVDASYDGDLVVAAGGIDYAHGREASSLFNESLAGVQLLDDPNESFDKQNLSISATLPDGRLLPGISPEPLPAVGSADDRDQPQQQRALPAACRLRPGRLCLAAAADRWGRGQRALPGRAGPQLLQRMAVL